MSVTRCAIFSVLVASTVAFPAAAQSKRPIVSLGIAAGQSVPAGQTGALYDRGYQFDGLAELRTPMSWLDVRLDAGYQGLGTSTFPMVTPQGNVVGNGSTAFGMASGTASILLRVPNLRSAIRPYAMAGFGSYWLHGRTWFDRNDGTKRTYVSSTTRVNGTHAGLGLEAPLARMVIFAEARYQHVGPGPLRFIPMSVGVRLP